MLSLNEKMIRPHNLRDFDRWGVFRRLKVLEFFGWVGRKLPSCARLLRVEEPELCVWSGGKVSCRVRVCCVDEVVGTSEPDGI